MATVGAAVVVGCGQPVASDAVAYGQALERATADPDSAVDVCGALTRAYERADCVAAAAEAIAPQRPDAAVALCATLADATAAAQRDECMFRVAELSADIGLCAGAGRYEDDCLRHLLPTALRSMMASGSVPGNFERPLRIHFSDLGFKSGDPAPWEVAYWAVLGTRGPMDRASCRAAPHPMLEQACRDAGLAKYEHRVGRSFELGTFPCEGGPLVGDLAHANDPELDGLVALHRASERCAQL